MGIDATLGPDGWEVPDIVSRGGSDSGGLANPVKLRSVLATLAKASWRRVNIGFHGMSLIVGYGAEDGTPGNSLTNLRHYRQRSAAMVMGARLNAALNGNAQNYGRGVNTVAVTADGVVSGFFSLSGATLGGQYGAAGPDGRIVALPGSASANSLSFVVQDAPAGTVVRVYGLFTGVAPTGQYALSGNNTQARTDVATAATTAAPLPQGNAWWYEYNITLPNASDSSTGTTVTLYGSNAATGSISVYAVDFDHKTTPGITVHRLACSGRNLIQVAAGALDNTDSVSGMTSWTGSGNANKRSGVMDSLTTRLALDVALCSFDVNDIMAHSTRTLADWKRHIANYLAAMSTRSIPVIFVLGTLRDPSLYAGAAYTQDELIAAYKAAADASSTASYIDLTDEYTGSVTTRHAAQITDASMFVSDLLHWSSSGHAYYGSRIAQALLSAANLG